MKSLKEAFIIWGLVFFFIVFLGAWSEYADGNGPFAEKFVDCLIILIALTLLGLVILCGYILVVLCAKDVFKFTKFIIDVDEQAKKLDDDSKK